MAAIKALGVPGINQHFCDFLDPDSLKAISLVNPEWNQIYNINIDYNFKPLLPSINILNKIESIILSYLDPGSLSDKVPYSNKEITTLAQSNNNFKKYIEKRSFLHIRLSLLIAKIKTDDLLITETRHQDLQKQYDVLNTEFKAESKKNQLKENEKVKIKENLSYLRKTIKEIDIINQMFYAPIKNQWKELIEFKNDINLVVSLKNQNFLQLPENPLKFDARNFLRFKSAVETVHNNIFLRGFCCGMYNTGNRYLKDNYITDKLEDNSLLLKNHILLKNSSRLTESVMFVIKNIPILWIPKKASLIQNEVEFYLENTKIKKIYINNLPKKTVVLKVVGSRLEEIPEGLSSLPSLKTLNLSNSNIQALKGLSSLPSLKTLNLSNNNIKDLTGLDSLSNLEYFDLSNNLIEDLTGLGSLPSLKTLDLSNNYIEDLTGLGSLSSLKTLNLSNNHIEDLTGLDSLSNLEYFDLSNNYIEDLEGLDSLSNLEYFDLSNNHIKDLERLHSLLRKFPKLVSYRI